MGWNSPLKLSETLWNSHFLRFFWYFSRSFSSVILLFFSFPLISYLRVTVWSLFVQAWLSLWLSLDEGCAAWASDTSLEGSASNSHLLEHIVNVKFICNTCSICCIMFVPFCFHHFQIQDFQKQKGLLLKAVLAKCTVSDICSKLRDALILGFR